jgi:DNA-directed RNA polymerase specialized sigma24 family protein
MVSGPGGGDRGGIFPATHHSAIIALRSEDPAVRARSLELVSAAYWRPVYKHLRLKWRKDAEEAADLTQAFFVNAFEREFFADYDVDKARFRTFVRLCLDRFVSKQNEAGRRLKRGGGVPVLSLDVSELEGELARGGAPKSAEGIEAHFDQEWARSLLAMSVDALRERLEKRGKPSYFHVFERYDLRTEPGKASYAEVARDLGLTVFDVTNYLSVARKEFRRVVLEKLRDITASDQEFREEARALLGEGAV